MLKLKHIKLKNFMNIASADLDLSSMMNLFQGNPGQGKSAVFEAISCCFSTEKKSGTYGEYVRRQSVMEDAEIFLEADIYGKPATFKMTINEDGGVSRQFTYDGETRTAAKDIDKALNELELRYYASIFLSMQGAHDISDMTPADRAKYIQKLLDFSFDEEIAKADAKITEVKDLITENDKDISAKEAALNVLRNTKYEEKPLPFDETVYNEYVAETSLKQQELAQISAEAALKVEAQQTLANRKTERFGIKSSIDAKNHEIEKMNARKAEIEAAKSQIESYNVSLAEAEKISAEKADNYKKLSEEQNKINNELSNLVIERTELNIGLDLLKSKKALIERGVCPECGQPVHDLDANIDDKLKAQEESLKEVGLKILNHENAKSMKGEELVKANQELAKANNEVSSYKILIKGKQELLANKFDENALNRLQTEIDALNQSLTTLDAVINDAQAKVDAIQIKDSKGISDRITWLNAQTSAYVTTIKDNETARKNQEKQAEDIKKYETELEACKLTKEKLAIKKADYDDGMKILKTTLPQFMSISICQKFTNLMNEFINKVFDEFTVRLDFKKTGCIFEYTKLPVEEDKWLNAKMASGYEKAMLTLSFKYALSNLYNIDIFIGDEIDKAANDDFSEKFFESLLNCGQFKQIFIISHHEYLRDYIENNFNSRKCYIVSGGKFVEDY